jgi:hypothetical protein
VKTSRQGFVGKTGPWGGTVATANEPGACRVFAKVRNMALFGGNLSQSSKFGFQPSCPAIDQLAGHTSP